MIRILRTILKIDSQLGKNASQTAMRTRLIRALPVILRKQQLIEQLACDNGSRCYITSLSTNQNREEPVDTSYVCSQNSYVIVQIE